MVFNCGHRMTFRTSASSNFLITVIRSFISSINFITTMIKYTPIKDYVLQSVFMNDCR